MIIPAILEDDVSSPRLWGCFSCRRNNLGGHGVFPTPVGVFLKYLYETPLSSVRWEWNNVLNVLHIVNTLEQPLRV